MDLFCCHFVVPSIHIILVEFIIVAIMLQNKSGSVNYGTQIVCLIIFVQAFKESEVNFDICQWKSYAIYSVILCIFFCSFVHKVCI